jgi:hypothetical protein
MTDFVGLELYDQYASDLQLGLRIERVHNPFAPQGGDYHSAWMRRKVGSTALHAPPLVLKTFKAWSLTRAATAISLLLQRLPK